VTFVTQLTAKADCEPAVRKTAPSAIALMEDRARKHRKPFRHDPAGRMLRNSPDAKIRNSKNSVDQTP
jgi:hypothetical protein